jgi:hypothetical protein
MAIGNTNVTMSDVYYEIFRASIPSNTTLEYLVLNSRLTDKTAPFDLGDFRNYDSTPTVTMSVLKSDATDNCTVTVDFTRSFNTNFTTTVYYTLNKQDGQTPVQESIQITPQEFVAGVTFTADRRTSDYQVSVTLDYCIDGYYTTSTTYVTIPAKVSTTNLAYDRGKSDAEEDNQREMNGEPIVGARPEYWGYISGTTEYNDYMRGYDENRLSMAGM